MRQVAWSLSDEVNLEDQAVRFRVCGGISISLYAR